MLEIALMSRRALLWKRLYGLFLQHPLQSAKYNHVHHMPQLWLQKRVEARDEGRSESMEHFWMENKGNTETFIIPPKTESVPGLKEQIFL